MNKIADPRGNLTFIEGDNGIGKSTLLQILQGRTNKGSKLEATIVLDGVTYTAEHNQLPCSFTQPLSFAFSRRSFCAVSR